MNILRTVASSLCLLLASLSAHGHDVSCGQVDPLVGLLSDDTSSSDSVTAASHQRHARSNDGFRRYPLSWINDRSTALPPPAPAVPGLAMTPHGARIVDIDAFVATCPQNDPATADILRHLKFSLNGVPLPVEPCTEPVPLDVRPAPLMYYLQMLRVAYYMDQTYPGIYPWTSGTYWGWIKTRIGGIDIDMSDPPSNYCCIEMPGRLPAAHLAGPWTLTPYQFVYDLLAGLALLVGHEVRHADGFGHALCVSGYKAGIQACDQDFDPDNLTPFGVAWWMVMLIETGKINMGLSCTSANSQIAAKFFLLEDILSEEFMGSRPPLGVASAVPGGPCEAAKPIQSGEGPPQATRPFRQ